MTNQVIAADFLFAVKSDIKMLAAAIAESHTPEVRETLTQYLNDSIDKHQEITDYMVSKGFYYPNDLAKQLGVDLQAAATASSLAQNQNQGQNQNQNQNQYQNQYQGQTGMRQNAMNQNGMGQDQGQNQGQSMNYSQSQGQDQSLVQSQNQNQDHYHNQVVAQHPNPNDSQNLQ